MRTTNWRLTLPSLMLVIGLAGGPWAAAQEIVDEEFSGPLLVEDAIELVEGDDPFSGPAAPAEEKPASVKDKVEENKAEEPEEEAPREPAAPVDPKVIRIHLMDGSVISGELTIEEITVETDFGKLIVPITSINSFKPGLDSYPHLADSVNGLIEKLGSDDYQTREQAHKDLGKMGLKVKMELERFKNDENAERKRHVEQILKEFESLAEEQADGDDEEAAPVEPVWLRDDTVVTNRFTAIGKIEPKSFTMNSKYGPLTVKLADVRMMDRESGAKETVRRKLSVPGSNLVQAGFKNSGVRVEAGDKITITADGSIVMSPWGSNMNSGPDGGQNYVWYVNNKIPGGALMAKIGSSGEEFKVGSKHSFVAKRSGVLQFAIAMQAQYAQQGYSYPGQYNVKVRVDPK